MPSPRTMQWGKRRSPRAAAVVVALALVAAACDNSKKEGKEEATIDTTSLVRAAASLTLSVGELVERYAAELPTGDVTEDLLRMESILTDGADPLGLETVGSSFTAAALASRQAGNNRPQAARQLAAAAILASVAFVPPQTDYRPGDDDMLAELVSSLEPQLNAVLPSAKHLIRGDTSFTRPDTVDDMLADGVGLAVMIGGYNYAGQEGSRPIRDRMRALGMKDPPGEFLDPGGILRLPQGGDSREQFGRFETWRTFKNPLLRLLSGVSRQTLKTLFRPAVEKAFE